MNINLIKEINEMLEALSEMEMHQVHSYILNVYKSKDRSKNSGLEKDQQPDQT